MSIPVIGWLYIIAGLVAPLGHPWLEAAWWAILVASAGLHPLQLFIAIPVARASGVSTARAVIMTIIFGAAWWKPLREGITER